MKRPVACLFILFVLSQHLVSQPLPRGRFFVGYRTVKLLHIAQNDSVTLTLNLWYPAKNSVGRHAKLLDFTHNHLEGSGQLSDSVKNASITALKRNIQNWFGHVDDTLWQALQQVEAYSIPHASPHSEKFPLILGRLRVFSTHLTNEYIASHGYVVCMLNAVEDYPPDNEEAYHGQLSREMEYYGAARDFLFATLRLTTDESGLLGFSGSGFSQFLLPMSSETFEAVALLESGVLLPGVGDILARHKCYSLDKFSAALLFLYNKQRFETTKQSERFNILNASAKHLVLFEAREQHHWDFASEGAVATVYLSRNASEQLRLFQKMNELIVSFFDRYLKKTQDPFITPDVSVIR